MISSVISLAEDDGRRWRTLGGDHDPEESAQDGLHHVDHKNPHSFEIEDLQKLILAATKVSVI